MLQQFIPKLIKDLELGNMSLASDIPGTYILPLDDLSIYMTDLPDNGFMLKCNIAPYPKEKEELFVTQAMLANLFGKGTRGAILGLNLEGTHVTLTHIFDVPAEYKDFKNTLEDFINTLDYWKEAAANPTPLK